MRGVHASPNETYSLNWKHLFPSFHAPMPLVLLYACRIKLTDYLHIGGKNQKQATDSQATVDVDATTQRDCRIIVKKMLNSKAKRGERIKKERTKYRIYLGTLSILNASRTLPINRISSRRWKQCCTTHTHTQSRDGRMERVSVGWVGVVKKKLWRKTGFLVSSMQTFTVCCTRSHSYLRTLHSCRSICAIRTQHSYIYDSAANGRNVGNHSLLSLVRTRSLSPDPISFICNVPWSATTHPPPVRYVWQQPM